MKHGVPEAKASLTLSGSIVLGSKNREYLEPIFEALREAQHQSGRFRILRLSCGSLSNIQRVDGPRNFQKDGAPPHKAAPDPSQEEHESGQNLD